MALKGYVAEIRDLIEDSAASPYREAEQSSAIAMGHSIHGDKNHPDYHPKAIAAHSTAMKHLAGALNLARHSNDIDTEKQLKSMYVRHHDAREAHRAAHMTAPVAAESIRTNR